MKSKKFDHAFFYNSTERDIVTDICILIEKLYKQEHKILVLCADEETVTVLDNVLWGFNEDSFIPHYKIEKDIRAYYPILIASDTEEVYQHEVLLALNGVLIKEKDRKKFAKIYYFFDEQDVKEKENARLMWKSFSSLKVVCKYWVNRNNKWVLKNSN